MTKCKKSLTIIIREDDIRVRKKSAPPGTAMRDKSKYSRKEKHRQNYRKEGWPDGCPSFFQSWESWPKFSNGIASGEKNT